MKTRDVLKATHVFCFGVPYEFVVRPIRETDAGAMSGRLSKIFLSDEYPTLEDFLCTYWHEITEAAIQEAHLKNPVKDHDDLDRLAHILMEGTLALISEPQDNA